MYYVVVNGAIVSDDKQDNIQNLYTDKIIKQIDVSNDEFIKNYQKYKVQNELLIDISGTNEYSEIQAQKNKEIQIGLLKEQIEELDKKRIRAICEPEIKDSDTGETWLSYYNLRIIALRQELAALE